jgi:hypothetical protein
MFFYPIGYLLSNSAVQMFSNKYNTNKMYCRNISGSEDVDLAKCLGIRCSFRL